MEDTVKRDLKGRFVKGSIHIPIHSETTRQKIRLANLGKKPSEETRIKISLANKGKKHSEESKEKMRLAKLGKIVSEETKQKLRLRKGEKNPMYGKHHTLESKQKISLANFADNNGMWRGDKVGEHAMHTWINKHLPKPETCFFCHEKKDELDLANITGKYTRKFSNWVYLCRKCHMESDDRIYNLKQYVGKQPE